MGRAAMSDVARRLCRSRTTVAGPQRRRLDLLICRSQVRILPGAPAHTPYGSQAKAFADGFVDGAALPCRHHDRPQAEAPHPRHRRSPAERVTASEGVRRGRSRLGRRSTTSWRPSQPGRARSAKLRRSARVCSSRSTSAGIRARRPPSTSSWTGGWRWPSWSRPPEAATCKSSTSTCAQCSAPFRSAGSTPRSWRRSTPRSAVVGSTATVAVTLGTGSPDRTTATPGARHTNAGRWRQPPSDRSTRSSRRHSTGPRVGAGSPSVPQVGGEALPAEARSGPPSAEQAARIVNEAWKEKLQADQCEPACANAPQRRFGHQRYPVNCSGLTFVPTAQLIE
jgi:hypothetical protein